MSPLDNAKLVAVFNAAKNPAFKKLLDDKAKALNALAEAKAQLADLEAKLFSTIPPALKNLLQPDEPKVRKHFVFISHSQADAGFADDLEKMLATLEIPSWNFNSAIAPGDNYLEKVKPAFEECTHIMVLVGPTTKDSRWVDIEMEVAMAAREKGPGAGLIGVILPNHDDFKRPFYDPELVPLRLHEYVSQQVAILKKWPDSPASIEPWLEDCERRRHVFQRRTRVSLSTLRLLREHHWTDEEDEPREALLSLSSQHGPRQTP